MTNAWSSVPPRKILLASDLSARGDRALDRALQLSRQWDAKLVLVHAMQDPPTDRPWPQDDLPSWRRPPDPARAVEERIRRDYADEIGSFEVRVVAGDPTEVVREAAEAEEADLIVLGAAASDTLGHLVLGNTTEQLVRKSPASLLIVKNRVRAPYRHILAGTDFTEESRFGLIMASRLFPQATIALMHAFEMPYLSLMTESKLGRDFSDMEEATIKGFVGESDLTDEARRRIVTMTEHGPPAMMLGKYASERGADLTVIGAYSRSLAFHLFIGGTARRIVEAVPSDVLVVRAPRPG